MNPIKYLLIIPDGMGIRNFFCTDFIDLLLESGEVCVWHALPANSIRPFQQQWGSRVRWQELPPIDDRVSERVIRQSKVYAQLYWQMRTQDDIQLKRWRPSVNWKSRLLNSVARTLGSFCGTPARILWLDRLHQSAAMRAPHTPAFEAFLSAYRPDIVFCAHQRALRAVPAMLAARRLQIPSATFIYSWDNLPKGRMAVYADHFFVWSDFMKTEMLTYYPDVTADRVHVVGAPQFQHYSNTSLLKSREAFFREWNLDLKRSVVCFSGNDVNSPYDPIFLADLAGGLRSVPPERRPQVLFRRSPVDRTDRYDRVLKEYPEIVPCDPAWKSLSEQNWSQMVPTQEDGALLLNVVFHSDVVVNVGSTMAMDFAAYDKPAVYIAYNPSKGRTSWDVEDSYRLPHFKTAHKLQPVYWAGSPMNLRDLVLRALQHPEEKSAARRAWLHLHVKQPMDRACARCADALLQLALKRRTQPAPSTATAELRALQANLSS